MSLRYGDDTSPEVKKFIDEVIITFARWDLIKFFHLNPHTYDTLPNIAKDIGRDPDKIEQDIKALIELGYLHQKDEGKEVVYCFTEDEEKRNKVDNFINFCKTRDGRFKTVYRILRGGVLWTK